MTRSKVVQIAISTFFAIFIYCEVYASSNIHLDNGKTVYDIALSRGGTLITYGVNTTLKVYSILNCNQSIAEVEVGDIISCVCFSNDSSKVIFGTFSGKIGVVDIKLGSVQNVYSVHNDVITNLKVIHNDNSVVSASYDKTFKIVDIKTGHDSLICKMKEEINSINIIPETNILLTIDGTGYLTSWNAITLNKLGQAKVDNQWGRDIAILNKSRAITCGDAGKINMIDMEVSEHPIISKEIGTSHMRIYCVDANSLEYGYTVVYGTFDGSIKLLSKVAFEEKQGTISTGKLPYRVKLVSVKGVEYVAVASKDMGVKIIPLSSF